jgi:hypothetical protein
MAMSRYKGNWFAFTPAGSLVYETGAPTRDACIKRLLKLAAHMPYGTWQNFEKRGYEVQYIKGLTR